jgi:cleavage stimulation factor subunit 3
MELTDGEFKKVEEIFQKCLPVAWTVDMFNFYLDYIRRMNNVLTGGEQARTTISQAYEFVLSIVGIDKDSGRIWADYLDFVKSSQVYKPINSNIISHNLLYRRTRNGRSSRRWIK